MLATKRGVGEYIQEMPYTWQLSWLAAERSWLALVEPFLTQIGIETSPYRGSISGSVGISVRRKLKFPVLAQSKSESVVERRYP